MLTIEQIEDVSFRKAGFSGYKTEDVDNFVDGVIDKVRDLQLTNKELQARVDQLSKKVVKYEQQADSVQDAKNIFCCRIRNKRQHCRRSKDRKSKTACRLHAEPKASPKSCEHITRACLRKHILRHSRYK